MASNFNNDQNGNGGLGSDGMYHDGHMYVSDEMLNCGPVGGQLQGGQWRHFKTFDPNSNGSLPCGNCGNSHCHHCHTYLQNGKWSNDYHGYNHHGYSPDQTTRYMMKYHGGNYAQLKNLNKIVKDRKATKVIYMDFDGIFSGTMAYNKDEKFMKTAQFSARYAIEMLRFYGFEVNIITGDQSGSGFDITNKILERIPVNSVQYVSGHDKFMHMSANHDITKIFYVGDDLFDLGMAAGRRTPILMTTANAMWALKNMAHYTALSGSHDYSVFDIASAILMSFEIDPIAYAAKTRRNKIATDLAANINFRIGNNIAFTENSQNWTANYLPILVSDYGVNPDHIGLTTPYVKPDNMKSVDDIYIATNLDYFVDNYASLRHNRTYFLLPREIGLGDVKFIETLMALDKLLASPLIEWTILTDHLSENSKPMLYAICMEKKLYNVLSATGFTDPQISPTSGG
ncbi:3-deoxy-D-manno-octulosonate 8-phosphate phosphatase [Chryseobacterium phage MA9V-2]|nr:3-deoxy-D-manno-octulosonate 8-phosphate phosphatase [Chryseobacterium phage MA9V-2]